MIFLKGIIGFLTILTTLSLIACNVEELKHTRDEQGHRGLNYTTIQNQTRNYNHLLQGLQGARTQFDARLAAQAVLLQNHTHVVNALLEGLQETKTEIGRRFAAYEIALSLQTGAINAVIMEMQETRVNMLTKMGTLEMKLNNCSNGSIGNRPIIKKTCPEGFKPFSKSCYLFGLMPTSRANAQRNCEQLNSYLVEVNNYVEDAFITRTLHSLEDSMIPAVRAFYTGGTDRTSEGYWIWENSGAAMTYTNWASGEGERKYRNDEDYHVYWKPDSFRWHDYDNVDFGGFICEHQLE